MRTNNVKTESRLLNSQMVAEYLGISINQAEKLMKNNEIVSFELGGISGLRTIQEEIENYIIKRINESRKLKKLA